MYGTVVTVKIVGERRTLRYGPYYSYSYSSSHVRVRKVTEKKRKRLPWLFVVVSFCGLIAPDKDTELAHCHVECRDQW
eukprot:scaffold1878_cov170-Amphora_coffeaeformis.AAC.17